MFSEALKYLQKVYFELGKVPGLTEEASASLLPTFPPSCQQSPPADPGIYLLRTLPPSPAIFLCSLLLLSQSIFLLLLCDVKPRMQFIQLSTVVPARTEKGKSRPLAWLLVKSLRPQICFPLRATGDI